MTKQEQIEEMAKFISNYADKHDWELHEPELEDLGIELYNAGYRKIDDLKAENKQLKTECALLDDELRIARQDTIDVLNKLKDYVNQLACDEYGDSACDTNYITIDIDKYEQDIDEMIEELTKCQK